MSVKQTLVYLAIYATVLVTVALVALWVRNELLSWSVGVPAGGRCLALLLALVLVAWLCRRRST